VCNKNDARTALFRGLFVQVLDARVRVAVEFKCLCPPILIITILRFSQSRRKANRSTQELFFLRQMCCRFRYRQRGVESFYKVYAHNILIFYVRGCKYVIMRSWSMSTHNNTLNVCVLYALKGSCRSTVILTKGRYLKVAIYFVFLVAFRIKSTYF